MHLLYLDDSGWAENKNKDYLVLGGLSLYENQVELKCIALHIAHNLF